MATRFVTRLSPGVTQGHFGVIDLSRDVIEPHRSHNGPDLQPEQRPHTPPPNVTHVAFDRN